jgi:hypothetical protein
MEARRWPVVMDVDDPEVEGWLEGPGEDLMVRVASGPRDPAELSSAVAPKLASELNRLADLADLEE